MNKKLVELEVQNAVDAILKPYKYIGSTTTMTVGLLVMNYELKGEPFSFRIIDEESSFSLIVDSDDEVLVQTIGDDAENIEGYINRVIYKIW